MINFKNILKVLLIALFVCAWSGSTWAKSTIMGAYGTGAGDVIDADTPYSNNHPVCELKGCPDGQTLNNDKCKCEATDTSGISNSSQDASFCSSNLGVFKELVNTGQLIFRRLRDLIYVVAGFGIIAVAVGGFFGNLNWKWLGAIVISLVVIATAGELIVLMTGCQEFGSTLITNTLTYPTGMSTAEYNQNYTEQVEKGGWINWNDSMDKEYRSYGGVSDSGTDATSNAEEPTEQEG